MREYWATFSILDHRAPFFKPSLLLFDGVVIPVPTRPYKGLDDLAELKKLDDDARYLQDNNCAIRYQWEPEKFETWRTGFLSAGVATRLTQESEARSENPVDIDAAIAKRDALLDTRYQLQHAMNSGEISLPGGKKRDIVAVPVFGAREGYQNLVPSDLGVDPLRQVTIDLTLKQMPIPAPNTELSAIVKLRKQGAVREAVTKLRLWQIDLLMDLENLADPRQRDHRIEQAELQLNAAIGDYERAMEKLEGDVINAWFTTLFSAWKDPVGCLGRLFTAHRDRFSFASEHELAWKTLHKEQFAFAGAIVAAKQLM
jgi:hypothetical protein